MRLLATNPIANAVWFQSCWFSGVLLQHPPYLLAALLILHFVSHVDPRRALCKMFPIAFIGIVLDSVLTAAGVFVFSDQLTVGIPLWLWGIWVAFVASFDLSLSFLKGRLWLASLLGAVSGTASYVAGMKLGAVTFGYSLPLTVGVLSMTWAIVLPLLLVLHNSLEAKICDLLPSRS